MSFLNDRPELLEITAFGGFRITRLGEPLALKNRKSQALLIYLATNQEQAHDRAILAELFWPDLSEAAALNNLSKALTQIRAALKQDKEGPALLKAARRTMQMPASDAWQLDANLFTQLLEQARHTRDPAGSVALLEQAVALYQGEFLAGFALEDCPTFESWLLLHRENLTLMARDSFQKITNFYLVHGDYQTARNTAREQLALDAWHEEAHRQLMQALAGMGLRNDALAQYETCRQILRSELGVEPELATRALYEQIKEGWPQEVGPGEQPQIEGQEQPAPRPLRPVQLPKLLLPLVGRDDELNTLKKDLADPACRMITIMGPGGVGKTSLALEAARQVAPNFDDGVYFVPLEHLQPSTDGDLHELLATNIGAALEITFSGIEPIHRQLFRILGDKEMLLVLDNFEHLLVKPESPQAFLVTLLERAPAVKVVVTSREHFGIPAEYVLSLDGLPIPETGAGLSEMANSNSVRLFVEQARRIQRDFRLTADNAPAVAQICQLVNGLPLGIELAARWISHFRCAEIAAAIQEDLNFLAAESPQVVERHQSLLATFTYSWRMLTTEEQWMLAQLSIILGPFSREAALAIAKGSLGDLVRLQGKSLLHQESPGHYSLHQLLRQFAVEKLEEYSASDLKTLRRRYCTYYLQKLAKEGQGFNQPWAGEAVRAIAGDINNIRSAWRLALEMGYFDLLDGALQAFYHYFRLQGLFHEAAQHFSHTVASIRARCEQYEGNRQLEVLLGRALIRQGRLAWLLADTHQAAPLLREGLNRLLKAGAKTDLPRAYAYLGENALRLDRAGEAGPLLDEALALYRQEGDNHGIAYALMLEGVQASLSGRLTEAGHFFEESIATSQHSGNRRLEGRGMHDWGMSLIEQGQIEQAAGLLKDSMGIAQELGLHMPVAFNQSMLARVDRHLGDYEQACRRLAGSLAILEGSGYADYTIRAQNMLGEVLAILGQTEEARRVLEKVLATLTGMRPAGAARYRQLVFDFLVASAHFFAHSGRDLMANRYLAFLLDNVGPETDIGLRARQLSAGLAITDLNQNSLPLASPADDAYLAQVIAQFHL